MARRKSLADLAARGFGLAVDFADWEDRLYEETLTYYQNEGAHELPPGTEVPVEELVLSMLYSVKPIIRDRYNAYIASLPTEECVPE